MKQGMIGRKVGMTQIFNQDGKLEAVTVVEVGPCYVVQKKSIETDGYEAVQLGFEKQTKQNKVTKPMEGHFKKAKVEALKQIKEFKLDGEYNVGDELKADVFSSGDIVDVQGYSKGKGFQGVMKRHNFSGGPASHGSQFHRTGGSIGMCEFPGRTLPLQKMPGQMGNKKVTTQNLKVLKVLEDKNLLLIKGTLPGHNSSVVYIKSAVKKQA